MASVVFPVEPRRSAVIGKTAIVVAALSVLGAGADRYIQSAPRALGLVTTAPFHSAGGDPLPITTAPVPRLATLPLAADTTPATTAPPHRLLPRPPMPKPQRTALTHPPPGGRATPPAVAATPLPPPDTNTTPGTLFVSAAPWGSVYVDGNPVGNTPILGTPLKPGLHSIRITREGYVTFERAITVEPAEAIRLTGVVLEPRHEP